MDGITATRIIRSAEGPAASLPIIALTANASPGDCQRYIEAGMDDVVSKPFNSEVLFATIEKVLLQRRTGCLPEEAVRRESRTSSPARAAA
jgi:CheY-like chemotaxis protein